MSRVRLKICGLTRETDVDVVAGLDVDAVGFVLWAGSPRAVTLARAATLGRRLPPWTARVGVFVRPSRDEAAAALQEGGIQVLQLHDVADPSPFLALGAPVVVALPIDRAEATPPTPGTTRMVDAHDPVRHGGTGRTIDWTRAAALSARERLILAGGLTADNVGDALRVVQPWGVDVSSGVEDAPGLKSAARLQQFVAAARRPFVETHS